MKITINFAYPDGQVNLGDNNIHNFKFAPVYALKKRIISRLLEEFGRVQ